MHVRAADRALYLQNEFVDPIPDTIATDSLRVRQVLINLIGNAVKFTHVGGIRLRVWTTHEKRPHGTVHFEVIDTGTGMSKAHIERVFGAFEQADKSTTRLYGGTGLGLSISRELVRMLGGEIQVSSEEGAGTTFAFTVDNDRERVSRDAPSPVTSSAPTATGNGRCDGRHILLCEDGKDNQRLIVQLRSSSFAVFRGVF